MKMEELVTTLIISVSCLGLGLLIMFYIMEKRHLKFVRKINRMMTDHVDHAAKRLNARVKELEDENQRLRDKLKNTLI